MTTPDIPLRMDISFELPGSPEQVWEAIATANGISSWFLPTEMEEREGGAFCIYMGDHGSSAGTVTGWDPPHRLVIEEPDWAALTGHDPASVTPMITEFVIEARSGGTCSLRVVTSAFGSGADWEQECFTSMEMHWRPYFDNLGRYLTSFPGQKVTSLSAGADVPGTLDGVWDALRLSLGAGTVGQAVEVRGLTGRVERIGGPPGPHELLLRSTTPVPGFLGFLLVGGDEDVVSVQMEGYLFSDDAPGYVEREKPRWKAWLENLVVTA
jgi:uncharacterized protein YndB with AHSA1/START domain